MKKTDKVVGEVKELHGVLSDNGFGTKKIYATVSWNGNPAKTEIRNVRTNSDGEEILGKGISISDDEMENLIKSYKEKKKKEDANKPVDFNSIFHKTEDIIEKRESGHVTENGFIVLQETGKLAEKAKKCHS